MMTIINDYGNLRTMASKSAYCSKQLFLINYGLEM